MKFPNPINSLTLPVLVTLLNAMRKTCPMGTMIKIDIKMTLGRIQK